MNDFHKEERRKLGLRIGYLRRLKGVTQEELAERVNKHVTFIGAIEAPGSTRTVSIDTLFDIAAALDIPAYKFFQFEDE